MDWATPVQFGPLGESSVDIAGVSQNVVENISLPSSYLPSAFVVQPDSFTGDIWIPDSGVSCHMTQSSDSTYSLRPPPHCRKLMAIGNRPKLRANYVGNVNAGFHGYKDERITLVVVSYVPCLDFYINSFRLGQRTHLTLSDASGAHIIGTNATFLRIGSCPYLGATRLLDAYNVIEAVRIPRWTLSYVLGGIDIEGKPFSLSSSSDESEAF